MNDEKTREAVKSYLEDFLEAHPDHVDNVIRQLMIALHTRGVISVDALHDQAHARAGHAANHNLDDPNKTERDRLDPVERQWVRDLTVRHVSEQFGLQEVKDFTNLTLKRQELNMLESLITGGGDVSFRQIAEKIHAFAGLSESETQLTPEEVMGTRVAMIRHFISDQLEYIAVAKRHLRIRDFSPLVRKVIGTQAGTGRIGGKAGGMFLAYHILSQHEFKNPDYFPIAMPDSYFVRSDVIEEFMRINRLNEWQNQKYKPIEQIANEFQLIKGVFRNGDFPIDVAQGLRAMLKEVDHHPLIVRSSSLLEDRFGTAFSGKYASVFVANQGDLEDRLNMLLGAIAEVYASVMAPDPIQYRREHHLIDYQEDMAILIQRVVGMRYRHYLFPLMAGVAFSRNEYRWTPRIKREDGLARLVMGLGTRAVDRVGSDYPRMVALGAPTIRPESKIGDILRYSQRTVDVINLETNRFESVRLPDLLDPKFPFPQIDRVVSVLRDDALYTPTSVLIDDPPSRLYITFDRMLGTTPFAEQLREILHVLEAAYRMPVDVEFAFDGEKLYILQCRPLSQVEDLQPVRIPKDIPQTDKIFSANRFVRNGLIEGVRYLIYISPESYDQVESRERRVAIARMVGRINRSLPRRSFILMGPGRWGSNDIRLGVPVSYADISQACLLIEVARQKEGYVPEVSFGTHFFQDLVEARIAYLPLYPDDANTCFNEAFLERSPNALSHLIPDAKGLDREIRLIDVAEAGGGRALTVAMDGESEQALAYLAKR